MGLIFERFFKSNKSYEVGKVYRYNGTFCEITRVEDKGDYQKFFYKWRKDYDPTKETVLSGSIEST